MPDFLKKYNSLVSVIASDAVVDIDVARAATELVKVEQKIYEVEYEDIDFPELFPVSNLNDTTATTFRYYYVEKAGKAELAKADGSINFVDAFIKGKDVPLFRGNIGYKYSIHEIETSAKLRVPLDHLKATTAMETVLEVAQDICYVGDDKRGIKGFFNNPAIPIIAKKVAKTWADMSPLEKLGEINHMFAHAYATTKKKEFKKKSKSNRLLLTTEMWSDIATTPLSETNPNYSILDYFVKKCPWIHSEDQVVDSIHMPAGTIRIYQKDPDKVEFKWGHTVRWMAPQRDNLDIKKVADYSLCGCILKKPFSVLEKQGL